MDVYHRVLIKLFEETGGSDSKSGGFCGFGETVEISRQLSEHI